MNAVVAMLLTAALCIAPPSALSGQKHAGGVQKAVGSVEWADPAGDINPINTSSGTEPGFDIVKLALASDGTALKVTATLSGPPKGTFASDVVKIYIDMDNNAATGYQTFWGHTPGFELRGALNLCIEYDNGGSACAGGMTGAKVKNFFSTLKMGKFVGSSTNTESIFPPFREPKGTVQGAVVSATVSYKDLGVKPGQTIRVVAVESNGPSDETAEFPVVLLTLK